MTCPHIVTSDEGTAYCTLAESAGPAQVELRPAESMALTFALAQIQRDRVPSPNVTSICVMALARITGGYDWTADGGDDS